VWCIALQLSCIGELKISEATGVLPFTSENASDPNEGKASFSKAIAVSFADEGDLPFDSTSNVSSTNEN
jgi:hypothetical protein